MSTVSVESGTGEGYTARVDSSGALVTAVEGTVTTEVSNTVTSEASPASSGALNSTSVSTSSVELKAANSSRRGLQVQNQGANSVYVNFGTGSATTSGFEIGAGVTYTCPVRYTGAIQAITASGSSTVLVVEFS